mmetsp:Transcript_70621/g.159729  ORF Transcript_70621/g.159729 Transcript_70621/m.159729 type:complete len:207 (+) Transcript_70621:458-1078(+)
MCRGALSKSLLRVGGGLGLRLGHFWGGLGGRFRALLEGLHQSRVGRGRVARLGRSSSGGGGQLGEVPVDGAEDGRRLPEHRLDVIRLHRHLLHDASELLGLGHHVLHVPVLEVRVRRVGHEDGPEPRGAAAEHRLHAVGNHVAIRSKDGLGCHGADLERPRQGPRCRRLACKEFGADFREGVSHKDVGRGEGPPQGHEPEVQPEGH